MIREWLVLEEAPAVNIIIQLLEENRFVVFRQKKYAIPGETLSPVGGFIDLGESPLVAAKREVLEELGLGSRQTLELIQSQAKSVENNMPVSSSSSLEVKDIAKIIANNAIPAAVDEYGLLIEQSSSRKPTPNVDSGSDSDWVFLGRYRTAANRGGGSYTPISSKMQFLYYLVVVQLTMSERRVMMNPRRYCILLKQR